MFEVTKTYGHERGISCCFRQPGAKSHCRFLHGYALSFKFVFESESLDSNNWVIDFGGLKDIEGMIKNHFDHRLVIARNDPSMQAIMALRDIGVADPVVMDKVGCEAFAQYAYGLAFPIVSKLAERSNNGVRIKSVTVAEHGSNSATYRP